MIIPPSFSNEEHFRTWLIGEIRAKLGTGWVVLDSKNVSDILVARQDKKSPLLVFLEVKYRKRNHGRIGFGGRKGSGFQPEILLQRPDYLERNMKWIIGNEKLNKCLILDNNQVREHCAGGAISRTKQNNFANGIFKSLGSLQLDTSDVPNEIVKWVKSL